MSSFPKAFSEFDNYVSKEPNEILGLLGIPLGGQLLVEVPNRNAFVYVRLRNNQSEVIQAYNNQVSPAYDLPVVVVREGTRYIIKGVDSQRYQNTWTNFSPYLPRHGNTHSFPDGGQGGGDPVWVYGRQFMPGLTIPSGSDGAPNAFISPYLLRNLSSQWKYIGNTGTSNLTIYNPTGSYGVMVLVYIDSVSGNPGFVVGSGSYFPATYTGMSQLVPYVPTISNPAWIPDSVIRLVSGTFVIGWDNIYDARQFISPQTTGTGGGGGLSSVAVQDEGVPQGNATTFNFVGPSVVASVSGSVAQIYISGGGGASFAGVDQIGIFGESAGIPLGTGTILNVRGSRLVFTISGTTLNLSNSPDPTELIGAYVWDEGIPLGTGTIFNFVGPTVIATISGSVVNVAITGIPSGTVQVFNSGTFLGSADKFNFQYPLAVGITGSMAYAYLNGFLIVQEDVSAQMTGSNSHFTLTGTIALGTDRLYYNGLRQKRITHYTVDADGKGFSTLFTGTFGDAFIIEYGNAGATPQNDGINIYDDSILQGFAYGVSFDSGITATVDANGLAHINGGSGGSGGAPTGAFYLLGKSESALPSGVVITGLLASADVDGRNAGGLDYEFDQTGTAGNFTWSTAPNRVNSHVDYMSNFHVVYSGTSPVVTRGSASYTITGAFDVRTKLSFGVNGSGSFSASCYFVLANSGNTYAAMILINGNSNQLRREITTYAGTGTWANDGTSYLKNLQAGPTIPIGFMTGPIYLRITKQVPDWIKFYYSTDGTMWNQMGEYKMGGLSMGLAQYMISNNQVATAAELLVDWLRSSV